MLAIMIYVNGAGFAGADQQHPAGTLLRDAERTRCTVRLMRAGTGETGAGQFDDLTRWIGGAGSALSEHNVHVA